MSQTEMNRVRDDLATMKRAAGVGLPIGRSDVCLSLAWAVAGVPLAAWCNPLRDPLGFRSMPIR